MNIKDITDIAKTSKLLIFLREKSFSILGFLIVSIILITTTSLIITCLGLDEVFDSFKRIIGCGFVLIRLIYRLYKRVVLPRNKKTFLGIVIAIDDKGEFEGFKIKQDLISSLDDFLDNKVFKVIIIQNHKCKRMDEDKIRKLNKKVRGHYRIYGKTEKQKDGNNNCYIETSGMVFHKQIPDIVKTELSKDFNKLYPRDISFDENWYKSGMKFSGEHNAIVAEYIIGVASFISGDPFSAWNLHKNLHTKLLTISKKDNVNASFDENYAKSLSEKIKLLQYRELSRISSYFYQIKEYNIWKKWLDIRKQLSDYYGLSDSTMLTQNGIYEFLVNKNITKSRKLIKEASKLGNNKSCRYSLVFLDIRNKEYKKAKDKMKQIIKQSFFNENMIVNEVVSFIDDVIKEYPDRFEFLYWQALLYLKKLNNISMSHEKFLEYTKITRNKKYDYEILDPKIRKTQ